MSEVSKDDFKRGYLIAVANIMHLHGDPVIATDVLRELGAKGADVKRLGMTSYDTNELRPLFKSIRRRG